MNPTLSALVLVALALPAIAQNKSRKDIPPPIEMTGQTRRTDVYELANGDKIIQYNNTDRLDKPADKPSPSRIRIFIPGNVKPGEIRGILFDLGYTYTPDRSDLQAVAREEKLAIVGCLLRYKYGTELLDISLKDFAERTGHNELLHCPIVPLGFSRNGSRAWDFCEENPARTIALGLGGNPGIPANFNNPARIEMAKTVPALTVVGSKDPFVDYDKGEARYWHNANYPKIRAHEGVTWGMMIGWGLGHGWGNSWETFVPFFQDVFALRDTEAHAADGAAKLAPIPFEKGWLGEYGWKTDWPEIAPVGEFKADKTNAIWLPAANTAAVWRAFEVQKPTVTLSITSADGKLTLTAGAPEGTTAVEFFDRATSIGTASTSPFSLTTDALGSGVRTVFAVATLKSGAKTPSKPTTVVAGKAIDWKVGDAEQKAAESPQNVIRLAPEVRKTLLATMQAATTQPAPAAEKPSPQSVTALRTALEALSKDAFFEQREAAAKLLKELPAE